MGVVARRQAITNPEHTVFSVKRFMGQTLGDVADELTLKRAGVVPQEARRIKVIASGSIDRAVTVKGLLVTPGARSAIEAAGGSIEN